MKGGHQELWRTEGKCSGLGKEGGVFILDIITLKPRFSSSKSASLTHREEKRLIKEVEDFLWHLPH